MTLTFDLLLSNAFRLRRHVLNTYMYLTKFNIGVGDEERKRGQGARAPPPLKKRENIFSGNDHVTFGHFRANIT